MTNNIEQSLVLMQDALNEFITPNWKENRNELDFMIANHQEMGELIDTKIERNGTKHSLGWKWWKESNKARTTDYVDWDNLDPEVIDNVKIELTDLLFFTLSQKTLGDNTTDEEEATLVENDWINFMSITANNLLQRPGAALMIIVELAKKLDFNITAYYCAKHLLNYYRQLDGYKDGSYKKNVDGVEDNVLLHDIIKDITIETFENDGFEKTYNRIADRFYEKFNVSDTKDQAHYDFWMNLVSKD